jgi:hypothetical protein
VGPLRYLIGIDNIEGEDGYVTEVSYDTEHKPVIGEDVWQYGNLFYEKYAEASHEERAFYGPYLHSSDVAEEYDEGQIDPNGPGWERNLDFQIKRCKERGINKIELDNPDAYHSRYVIDAVNYVAEAGLLVIAKNALLVEGDASAYLAHPAVVACVVEKGAGTCDGMEQLRRAANKPLLPIRYVAFGDGKAWALKRKAAIQSRGYVEMGVTYSPIGEYSSCRDILKPVSTG